MSRGLFIAFEGIDASGKSTQARRLAASRGALFTFEPGDTAVGAELRRLVLDAATPMDPVTASLIMLADRAHHARTVIEPALAAGRDVVSDRYAASTLAYQGYGSGVDLTALESASALAVGSLQPDLTILLDLPVELARSRRTPRAEDRYESLGVEYAERVRAGFLELARRAGDWLVLDATLGEDEVFAAIEARLAESERDCRD